jgi:hypothetical protein
MAIAAEELAAPVVDAATAKKLNSAFGKKKRRAPTASQRNSRTATAAHRKRETFRTEQHGLREQQRVAAASQIAGNNQQIRQAAMEAQRSAAAKRQRNSRVLDVASTPFQPQPTVNVGSSVNPLMLILFTWAGIVLLYVLITSPNATTGFLGSLRTWIGLIYANKPMFSTQVTPATPTGVTS